MKETYKFLCSRERSILYTSIEFKGINHKDIIKKVEEEEKKLKNKGYTIHRIKKVT